MLDAAAYHAASWQYTAEQVQECDSCPSKIATDKLEKLDIAVRETIQVNSRGNLQLVADQFPKDPGGRRKTRALPTDLVFMDDSPDYCRQDRAAGTLGTQGRICRWFS